MPMGAYRYAGDVIGHAVLLRFVVTWMLMDAELSPGWRRAACALFWSATVWWPFMAINVMGNPHPHTVFRPGFP